MLAMFECIDFLRWNCPKTIKDTGSYEPVSFMVFGFGCTGRGRVRKVRHA